MTYRGRPGAIGPRPRSKPFVTRAGIIPSGTVGCHNELADSVPPDGRKAWDNCGDDASGQKESARTADPELVHILEEVHMNFARHGDRDWD